MESQSEVIFILFGNICDIADIIKRVKESGKIAIVHVDLVVGFGSKEIVSDFIKHNTMADGIISTKPNIIKRAKELKLLTVQRFFLIDSIAKINALRQLTTVKPDMIELLPGLLCKCIKEIAAQTDIPIIVGGLIEDKNDITQALSSGASAISATCPEVWNL